MGPVIDGERDPLGWRKLHKINFPILSKLACKYVCVPATSSPSERLFSASSNIVTCQRACLKPAMADMLVFLAKKPEEIFALSYAQEVFKMWTLCHSALHFLVCFLVSAFF